MNKETILSSIISNHETFTEYVQSLSEEEFMFSLNGEKWTAGQEVQHIIWSVNKLYTGLQIPKFAMKMTFGVANRPSRTYDEVVNKYAAKIREGGASIRLELDPVPYETKNARIDKLRTGVNKLCGQAAKYSEKDLDYYILPHPILGKMTIRELLYFKIIHVRHHKSNSMRNLSKIQAPQ